MSNGREPGIWADLENEDLGWANDHGVSAFGIDRFGTFKNVGG